MSPLNAKCKLLILAVLFVGLVPLAQAGAIGFSGPYDPSNWTLSNPVGGAVDSSLAPTSVTITGGNISLSGYTTWTIAAPAGGLVSFDWSYSTSDWDPSYDPAGYVVNGSFTQLTIGGGGSPQSGSTSFSVIAGDTFGFYVYTTDGGFGPGTITPSNFIAPDTGVPEPATWLLVCIPLVLVAARRRRA